MTEEEDAQHAARFPGLVRLASTESPFTAEGFSVGATRWDVIKVLVVGAGGLGCELLHCLALSGFTDIHVIDMDTIDLSNLNRQFLFRNADIGKPKADVAAAFVNKRCPWVNVTPHFGRVEEQPNDFYRQFQICILGLDSIHARQWMNEKYASLIEYGLDDDGKWVVTDSVPIIDGGTEGYKGSIRVIKFGVTACVNCTMYLFPPQKGVPMCTLENVPRVPEHCVLYVKEKTWEVEKPFGATSDGKAPLPVDGDNQEHILWIMRKAKLRQEQFKLGGDINFAFTQGVVKNVIPAVGFTNALVAAMCVNEALKLATGIAQNMNCFGFYNGADNGITSSVNFMQADPSCSVCQIQSVDFAETWTPRECVFAALTALKLGIADLTLENATAQMTAFMDGETAVPLVRVGPLAATTEALQAVPVAQTLREATGSAVLSAFRVEFNGGQLKNRSVSFLCRITQ